MLRRTVEQIKEVKYGKEVLEKYFGMLGVEDFYIGQDVEDLVAGLQFLVEKTVRENGLVDLTRRNQRVHKILNVFLNNHNFLVAQNIASIHANRIDQLWLAVLKYIESYASEYSSQIKKDKEAEFLIELNNLTLPE